MAYFWVISSDIGWVITAHHQHSEVEWLWKQLDSFVVCHLLMAFFYLTVYNVQYILNIMTNGNITLIYSFVTICEQNRKDFIVHGSGERPT